MCDGWFLGIIMPFAVYWNPPRAKLKIAKSTHSLNFF